MRNLEGNILLSASNLSRFMGCAHPSTPDQARLSDEWTDKDGTRRPIRDTDIIVVAPCKAQVNALRDALPPGIRVDTVDKFQGQEAPVSLVSMPASSAEETLRGMDFLFLLNRIKKAVSRAKALTPVFGAFRLGEAKCETVEQMRLVNTFRAVTALAEIGEA